MAYPQIVTREEWLTARAALLTKEKEATHARDRLNAERRRLPMVKMDKEYRFEGPAGTMSLLDLFDVPVAAPLPMSLVDVMADKEQVWENIKAEHGLVDVPFSAVSSWGFGDGVFSWDYDFLSDSSKARRAGFHDYVETEEMFRGLVRRLREKKIIP